MDKIICLVGESGSGKTTICKELEKEGHNVIKSYTTRKPRHEGEYGHIFVDGNEYLMKTYESGAFEIWKFDRDDEYFGKVYDNVHFIAYTEFDKEHYWATREQYKDKGISIYPIDVKGIEMLRESVKDAEIVVIYLNCELTERYDRLFDRYKDGEKAIDRLNHDKEVFKVIKCDYAIDTDRVLEEVLKDIRRIVEGK